MSDYKTQNYNNGNQQLPYIIIIILLAVIAVLAFFLGQSMNGGIAQNGNNSSNSTNTITPPGNDGAIVVTIIDDLRCNDCNTTAMIQSLQDIPALANAEFKKVDFSDDGVEEIMKENGVTLLPAVLFNTNNVSDSTIQPYLNKTSGGFYSLNMGATYNPYEKRSDRGFRLVEAETLDAILADSRVIGGEDAEILWVEYSDMDCAYCKRMHNEGTHETLFDTFGDNLAVAYQYYAIFNREAPKILECVAELKGNQAWFNTITAAYQQEAGTKDAILAVVDGGVDQEAFDACMKEGKNNYKVDAQMQMGSSVFNITGTPGNVLINTETLEYEILPGAYPVNDFINLINSLQS